MTWKLVKDPVLHCVVVDVAQKVILYNPRLAMVRFESPDRFFVYQWDLKRPEAAKEGSGAV